MPTFEYAAPVAVTALPITVKGVAVRTGYQNSQVVTNNYVQIQVAAPTFTPVGGTYPYPVTISIVTTTIGAVLKYSIDGSTPTLNYTGPVTVNSATPLKAVAVKDNWLNSAEGSMIYNQAVVPVVTFTPGGSSVVFPQTVFLATTLGGSTIYYTIGSNPADPTISDILYNANTGVTVNAASTIKAIAVSAGYQDSATTSASFTHVQVAAPTFAQNYNAAGGYWYPNTVTLACATSGAAIYYTVDGSPPTEASTLYSAAFNITASVTVKARAFKTGYLESTEATRLYDQQRVTQTPAITQNNSDSGIPNATGAQYPTVVTITGESGSTFYYTVDGSAPDNTSTLYSGPYNNLSAATIKAIAYKIGYAASAVAAQNYTQRQVVAPQFNTPSGELVFGTAVSLSTTTPLSAIYYTVDGSTPTNTATLYTGPITINTAVTVKAIAYKSGGFQPASWLASSVTTVSYTGPSAPVVTIDPNGSGEYEFPVQMLLSTATPVNAIYYTVDGSTPTNTSTLYTGYFTVVNDGIVVKAFSVKTGYLDSSVVTATIVKATTKFFTDFSPAANTSIVDGQSVVGLRKWYSTAANAGATDQPITGFFNGTNVSSQMGRIRKTKDGKYVVTGQFTSYGVAGSGFNKLDFIRLNQDLTPDVDFRTGADFTTSATTGQRFCADVVELSDGTFVVGGAFGTVGSQTRNNLVKFNNNGSINSGFTAGTNGPIKLLAVNKDDKILVIGAFSTITPTGGVAVSTPFNIAVLNSDGTLLSVVSNGITSDFASNNTYNAIKDACALADGGFLFTGALSSGAGIGFVKITPTGVLFSASGVNPGFTAAFKHWSAWSGRSPLCVKPLRNGGFMAGGSFDTTDFSVLPATSKNRVALFNANGSLNTGFTSPGFHNNSTAVGDNSGYVTDLEECRDGDIFVHGVFNSVSVLPNLGWTAQTSSGSRSWWAITSSADGERLAAVELGGAIYTSVDRGVTWVATNAGSRQWYDITSSADGERLAAVAQGGLIYTSVDRGVTWVATNSGIGNWYAITSSADGERLAAVVYGGSIYSSVDRGVSWTERTSSGTRNWTAITSSADGDRLAAVVFGGSIYTSSDRGVNWQEQTSTNIRNWYKITSSADGEKLAAVVFGGSIYTSSDRGVTWVATNAGSRSWYDITSSADGERLAAVVNGGSIYTSVDRGVSWTAQTAAGTRNWTAITSSADGERLAAGDYIGLIYTYTTPVLGQPTTFNRHRTLTKLSPSGVHRQQTTGEGNGPTAAAPFSSLHANKMVLNYSDNPVVITSPGSLQTYFPNSVVTAGIMKYNYDEAGIGNELWRGWSNGNDSNGTVNRSVTKFTLNDSDPAFSSSEMPASLTLNQTDGVFPTVKFRAVKPRYMGAATTVSNFKLSELKTSTYTWAQVPTPTGSPAAGAIAFGSTVTLACSLAGSTIYYTVDGSAPTTASTLYSAPFAINSALTVKALAVKAGYKASEILTSAYTQLTVATPTAAPPAGAVPLGTSVALSCATAGATIHYTVDGTNPGSYVNLIPVMTSNISPSGVVSASSVTTASGVTFDAWRAVGHVNILSNQWIAQNLNSFPQYWQYQFSSPKTILRYRIIQSSGNDATTGTLQGGNYGSAGNFVATTSPSQQWYGITSSADGEKLAATGYTGSIYTSSDRGVTWVATNAGSRPWYGITSSADGERLAAVVIDGFIYTSVDRGASWTERTSAGSRQWYQITSSADGERLAAVVIDGFIYTSSDRGVTWVATNSGSLRWWAITSSADGERLAAVVNGGSIYTSVDRGVTWVATNAGSRQWYDITSSADGERLAAVVMGGLIYTSIDRGFTWVATNAGTRNWNSIASSADGERLAAAVLGQLIYTSVDRGVSWTAQTSAGNQSWTNITSSADGERLAATVWQSAIYTRSTPLNWTTIDTYAADATDYTKIVANPGTYTHYRLNITDSISNQAGLDAVELQGYNSIGYTGAIVLNSLPKDIKAIGLKAGCINSAVLTSAYTQSQVATPVATPGGSAVQSGSTVLLSCATPVADIWYTLNGDLPVQGSVDVGGQLIAMHSGPTSATGTASASSTGTFGGVLLEAWRAFDRGTGPTYPLWSSNQTVLPQWLRYTFTTSQTVASFSVTSWAGDANAPRSASLQYWVGGDLHTDTSWLTAYSYAQLSWAGSQLRHFTLNTPVTSQIFRLLITETQGAGGTPVIQEFALFGAIDSSGTGQRYTGPIIINSVNSPLILKAKAFKTSFLESDLLATAYTQAQTPTPTFIPVSGTTGVSLVQLDNILIGSTLRYTIDGSTPTISNGFTYSGPFGIVTPKTVKAYSYKSGYIDSAVSTATYP